ncbi:phosphatase PAP2 family protein [Chondromyces apiculatus]|uniref:Phosphatidic acid phosphatase type 2/haloperoxidase domain-containing protein n=1 Tax=Chondromyces apiculatus DSM 436 TaxID=1192034 RepID=A0A017TC17_9BACT|nr:phosphatase PAP2 family protein [Chondromyces apiculatus]EYF06833.1 Hypothetical protein CAP_1530 [Chondromyces apiculatus DSM 436]
MESPAPSPSVSSPPRPQILERLLQRLPFGQISLSAFLGAVLIVGTTFGFAWLADEVFENQFATADNAVLLWIHAHQGPRVDALMHAFTFLGGPLPITLLLTGAGLTLLARRHFSEAFGVALAGLGCALINSTLKHLFARARPSLFDSPFHLTSYSFPSGHAMGSTVGFGILAYLFCRRVQTPLGRAAAVSTALLTVIFVGLSRMYFGVHFPTDILGGYLAGALWLTLSIVILRSSEWWYARRARA